MSKRKGEGVIKGPKLRTSSNVPRKKDKDENNANKDPRLDYKEERQG